GDTFVIPKPDIKAEGARIMSLDDPTKKMSKSNPNQASYIALSDDPDTIRRKIKRAVTDSGSEIISSPDKPALANLISIYAILADMTPAEVEAHFVGKGYGAFKTELGDIVVDAIRPIQERLAELEAEPDIAISVLTEGAAKASALAARKMAVVRDRMGIGTPRSYGHRR
ncbi:MAG: tryptophan--tRNA ligase, partial [Thermomicrobiales bacterium]